jgi:hypothetical protein
LRLYWTWESIPELAGLPRQVQRRAWQHAVRRTVTHPLLLTLLVVMSLGIVIAIHVAVRSGNPGWLPVVVATGAGMASVFGHLLAHWARPHLRSFLREQGEVSHASRGTDG